MTRRFLGTVVHKLALDRALIRQIRSLDEYDLRRLQSFVRGLLGSREGRDLAGEGRPKGKVTFRRERVRCGRENCARCPHGPYWYAYWREDGKVRKRYLGTAKPK